MYTLHTPEKLKNLPHQTKKIKLGPLEWMLSLLIVCMKIMALK
jgi:hypothetical protein